jgi:hypothetical protein
MSLKRKAGLLSCWLLTLVASPQSWALNEIIRPYQSVRSFGQGGTRITTARYEDVFFSNPARVTANPRSRFTILDITPLDVNSTLTQEMKNFSGASKPLKQVAKIDGKNLHARIQWVLPAYYRAVNEEQRMAWAIGFLGSLQSNIDLRRNYSFSLDTFLDFGPAITLGYEFLEKRNLSVGLTTHLSYRFSTLPNVSLMDYLSGTPLSASKLGGDGTMLDFDWGATYRFWEGETFQWTVGASIQNLLGGSYTNLKLHLLKNGNPPRAQPRSFGLGISGAAESLWVLQNSVLALEMTDLGNNPDGSFYRLLHLGFETQWNNLQLRLGINQGYLTAGFGMDFKLFSLHFATYGEEMGLNAGQLEDRRYALNLGIHL